MVENTNVNKPIVNTIGPITGKSEKAALVKDAPFNPCVHSVELTITIPVKAQTTTVSQKVPVEDTNACRTGFLVCAAAATIGALPSPDSFENNPRAIPNRIASLTPAPRNPPIAACPVNALSKINFIVDGIDAKFKIKMMMQPST